MTLFSDILNSSWLLFFLKFNRMEKVQINIWFNSCLLISISCPSFLMNCTLSSNNAKGKTTISIYAWSLHMYKQMTLSLTLIHYRNTNSVHIKTNSSVNHCTVTHIPGPIICHCMHWHTVNLYIRTKHIVTPKPVPLKTNVRQAPKAYETCKTCNINI